MKKSPTSSADVSAIEERINSYMNERKKLDLNTVYNRIKDKYPIVLTSAYATDNGREDYGEDYQILRGESSVGIFTLYDNGLNIIFDADKADGTYTHWHPADIEEAIRDVILFMDGISRH